MSLLGMADARLTRERAERASGVTKADRASLAETVGVTAESRPAPSPQRSGSSFQGLGDQLVRYFPAELIGAYIFFLGVLVPAAPAGCGTDFGSQWIALVAFTVFAPILQWLIYVGKARQTGIASWRPPWFECIVTTVAFFAWAIALPASPMFSFCGWRAGYGAFAAAAVAFLIPLISAALGRSPTPPRSPAAG